MRTYLLGIFKIEISLHYVVTEGQKSCYQRHTSTFRKEKSSSTPAAGFTVVFGAADIDGIVGCGAGFVTVAGVVVVVVVVIFAVVAVVLAVIMLEFLTIEARNSARVDGKKPL
jgi:hypothetical protein